jgi:hypothetical protein
MLADLIVLIHFAFVLFVIFGGLLALRWPKAAYVHLPIAAYGALIELVGWICPLTPLEKRLRESAGLEGYQGGFVEHYILPVLYPSGLTPNIQVALGGLVIVLNLAVYALVLRSSRIASAAARRRNDSV